MISWIGLLIITFISLGFGFHSAPFSCKVDSNSFFPLDYNSKELSTNMKGATIYPTSLSSVKLSYDNSDIFDSPVSITSFMILSISSL